jgi:pimeloyl-ACP methyl ester carboxylesterase
VRNGGMGWVGNCFSWWSLFPFCAYDMWGHGLSGGQLIPHFLHAVQVLTNGPVLYRTIWYSLLVEGWIQALGIWHWGQLL